MKRPMLMWEAALTFATSVTASLGLINVLSGKTSGLLVIVVQGLNAATVVYKTGQWNPNDAPVPAHVVVVPASPPTPTSEGATTNEPG